MKNKIWIQTGFIIFAFCWGIFFGEIAGYRAAKTEINQNWQKMLIESNLAQYNPKTANFEILPIDSIILNNSINEAAARVPIDGGPKLENLTANQNLNQNKNPK